MAAHMRAELCATLPQADATLAARSTLPPLDVATLTTLQVLSRRVARAERIAERTRERAVVEVGQRLTAAGSGLAIHPTAVRDRASAVEAARAELVEAERALADHVAEAAAAEAAAVSEDERVAEQSEVPDHADESPQSPVRARRGGPSPQVRRSRSLGVLVSSFG